jgi:hypothetical protein
MGARDPTEGGRRGRGARHDAEVEVDEHVKQLLRA